MLVALSGGPDSTALLHLLARLRSEWSWELVAGHFDHGVRPGGSDRVAGLRERLLPDDIRLVVGRPDRELDRDHETLRRARYDWLREAGRGAGADRIATGHQRDDEVETVLFRILRGAGNRGLAGIPARRGPIVRPLLAFPRRTLADWLAEHGIRPLDDPSNRDRRYARSRLRHDLLPVLEAELDGDVREALGAIGDAAEEVRRATKPVARRVLAAFADGSAADWPAELRAEALRLAARRQGVRLRGAAARVAAADMLELTSGHGLDLGGGLRLERVFDSWTVRREGRASGGTAPPDETLEIRGPRAGAGAVHLGGRRWRVRWAPGAGTEADGTCVALYVPRDHYPLSIRAWSAGDRIRLPAGSRKLARLMSEARVPARDRPTTPIVTNAAGRVLCVMRPDLTHRIDVEARRDEANFNLEVEDVEDG